MRCPIWGRDWCSAASGELAISVERPYQGAGIGRALFHGALHEARDSGIGQVSVSIFSDDARMRHIAETSGIEVVWDEPDTPPDEAPAWATADRFVEAG